MDIHDIKNKLVYFNNKKTFSYVAMFMPVTVVILKLRKFSLCNVNNFEINNSQEEKKMNLSGSLAWCRTLHFCLVRGVQRNKDNLQQLL